MVVFAALDNGLWTEISERDFMWLSKRGRTINQHGREVLMYNRFGAHSKAYDVYLEGELYAWCRPVDNKAPDRRVYVV